MSGSQYITISEAEVMTKRSGKTIVRRLKELSKNNPERYSLVVREEFRGDTNSPYRRQVRLLVDWVREAFSGEVSPSWTDRQPDGQPEVGGDRARQTPSEIGDYLSQIATKKDEQIQALSGQLSDILKQLSEEREARSKSETNLNERLRESHILLAQTQTQIKELQQRVEQLALEAPKERAFGLTNEELDRVNLQMLEEYDTYLREQEITEEDFVKTGQPDTQIDKDNHSVGFNWFKRWTK